MKGSIVRRRFGFLIIALSPIVLLSLASAHAFLTTSTPENQSTVGEVPSAIDIVFSEPIEVRFSNFKIYPLAVEPGMTDREIALAANELVSQVLSLKDDEEVRVDSGVLTGERTSKEIALGLEEGLEPGVYVVMWHVLSVDTHATEDFFFFRYDPAP